MNGAIHPITGTFDETVLSVIWGTPETEIGRSEYAIVNDQLSVRDFVLSPSGWRAFMTVVYDLEQNKGTPYSEPVSGLRPHPADPGFHLL